MHIEPGPLPACPACNPIPNPSARAGSGAERGWGALQAHTGFAIGELGFRYENTLCESFVNSLHLVNVLAQRYKCAPPGRARTALLTCCRLDALRLERRHIQVRLAVQSGSSNCLASHQHRHQLPQGCPTLPFCHC